MSQEGCVSHLHRPSPASTFPSSRAPPGCRIQPLMSSFFRPLRSRKPSTSPRIFPPIISGTSLSKIMWNPESRRSNRSEEHTFELQSPVHLVCRLLLEKKKKNKMRTVPCTQQY